MKKIILPMLMVLLSAGVYAQSVDGDWYGILETPKGKLHAVFHVKKTTNGYSSTMDSPDQGAKGIATDATTFENGTLTIEMKKIGMNYTATYDPAVEKLTGVMHQGMGELPLVLKRTREEIAIVRRPQDPVDFPYTREEVSFKNIKDTVTLAGTLTLPKDKKADKIVILITGSGPQNRDEEIKKFNHRPFLVWSDWLTRHGIAVLRYDDRGVAKSTGNFATSTTADFAQDVTAAIDFIKSRGDLKNMSIGLMGHSEGGMIAPMIAAKDKRVDFIVLLAGPGIPMSDVLIQQSEYAQQSSHVPKEIAGLNVQMAKEAYDYLKANADKTNEQMEPGLRGLLKAQLAKYPPGALSGTSTDEVIDKQMKTFEGVWFRYSLSFNPANYLSKVKCPVLAVNGTLDRQVSAKENLAGIEAALKKAKNKHYVIMPLPGLNHLLQKAQTGDVSEYGSIDETVDTIALNAVTDWMNKL